MNKGSFKEYFWSKVDIKGPDECWNWGGNCFPNGYGQTQTSKKHGYSQYAHRTAWILTHGPIGLLEVLHRCDNRPCCNPEHLWLGTQQENLKDMVRKGRHNRGERNGGSKLTESLVREILKDTRLHRIIAQEYGVCRPAIARIKSGASWSHLKTIISDED